MASLGDDVLGRIGYRAGNDAARRRKSLAGRHTPVDERGSDARFRAQEDADDRPQPRHSRRTHHPRPEAGHLVRRASAQPAAIRARARRGGGREDLRRRGHLRAPSPERGSARVQGPWSNAIAMPSSLQFWRCWAPRSRNSPPRFGISSGRRSGRRKSRLPRGKRARPRCRTSAIQFFPKT